MRRARLIARRRPPVADRRGRAAARPGYACARGPLIGFGTAQGGVTLNSFMPVARHERGGKPSLSDIVRWQTRSRTM
jgi:hypothetical protein